MSPGPCPRPDADSPAARPPARRRLLAGFALVAAVAVCALVAAPLTGCSRSDPERELRATIDTMARAIEQREPGAFLDALAEDFTRDSGAFGKQDAKRLLAAQMLRNERIALAVAVTELSIDGDRARVTLRVIATGSAGGLLPERGQTWEFSSAWRRHGRQWQVFNAEWSEGL